MCKGFIITIIFIFTGFFYLLLGHKYVLSNPIYVYDDCSYNCPSGSLCNVCLPHLNKVQLSVADLDKIDFWKHVLLWPVDLYRYKTLLR